MSEPTGYALRAPGGRFWGIADRSTPDWRWGFITDAITAKRERVIVYSTEHAAREALAFLSSSPNYAATDWAGVTVVPR